ncbi:MAG: hypothetical protein ACI4MI_04475 [Christensenellales bacterium]
MNIDKILEYQKVDMEFIKLEEDMRKSEEYQKYFAYQNERKRAVEEVKRLNSIAEQAFADFATADSQYQEAVKEVEELSKHINENTSDDELEYYGKQLDKYAAIVDGYEKDLSRLKSELGQIQSQFKTEMDNASKAGSLEKTYAAKFDMLRKSKMPLAKELDDKKKAIAKEVDAKLMEVYNDARKRGKKPVFVPYNKEGHACACGIEVDTNIRDKMDAGALFMECPNCGRIMYNKQ